MAAAFVQSTSAEANINDLTLTLPAITVTAGNALMLYCGNLATGITMTVTDGVNTWVGPVDDFTAGGIQGGLFYALNVAGGSTTVNVNFAPSAFFRAAVLHEVSGIALTSALDQHTIQNANPTSAVTPTTDNQYVFVGVYNDSGNAPSAPGAGFNLRESAATGVGYGSEDQVQTTATAVTPGFTIGGGTTQIGVMTFKAVAAPASGDFGGPSSPLYRVRLRSY